MSVDPEKQLAVQNAICEALEVPMATRWYVVAEVIDGEGEPYLMGLRSPGLYPWTAAGLLRWEADSLAAQPQWARSAD